MIDWQDLIPEKNKIENPKSIRNIRKTPDLEGKSQDLGNFANIANTFQKTEKKNKTPHETGSEDSAKENSMNNHHDSKGGSDFDEQRLKDAFKRGIFREYMVKEAVIDLLGEAPNPGNQARVEEILKEMFK